MRLTAVWLIPVGLRHRARTPVGGTAGRGFQRLRNDPLDVGIGDPARGTGARFIEQPVQATIQEAFPPLPHHLACNAEFLGDGVVVPCLPHTAARCAPAAPMLAPSSAVATSAPARPARSAPPPTGPSVVLVPSSPPMDRAERWVAHLVTELKTQNTSRLRKKSFRPSGNSSDHWI